MRVKEIMCRKPDCCTPYTTIQEAAQKMVDCDCGAIPVVDERDRHKPIGIITDRDIACRAVARGMNPATTTVGDCMTSMLATVPVDASIEECCQIMEERKVRRLLAVDRQGRIAGIVAQADIALHLSAGQTAEVVKEISEPFEHAAALA